MLSGDAGSSARLRWRVPQVGELRTPLAVCNEEGVVVPTGAREGEGPWDLVVTICGEEGDAAYGFPFRVRFRFDPDFWPSKLALVRFQCVFHHALTDDSDGTRGSLVNLEP